MLSFPGLGERPWGSIRLWGGIRHGLHADLHLGEGSPVSHCIWYQELLWEGGLAPEESGPCVPSGTHLLAPTILATLGFHCWVKRVCQGSRAKATHFSGQRRLAPQPGSTSLLCLYVDLGAGVCVQIIEFFELEGPWLRRHERKKTKNTGHLA